MLIDLNVKECQRVKVALVRLAKHPEVDEGSMGQLLILSGKFIPRNEPKKIDEIAPMKAMRPEGLEVEAKKVKETKK